MKRGLVGRVERLESEAVNVLEASDQPMTADEFAESVEATMAEYLELGYLVETPSGLEIGDGLSRTSHEHSVAILLTAFPEILRYSGFKYPDGLREFGGGDCE